MCSLPAGLARPLSYSCPLINQRKLRHSPLSLEEVIPLDIDDVVYDYQVLNKNG